MLLPKRGDYDQTVANELHDWRSKEITGNIFEYKHRPCQVSDVLSGGPRMVLLIQNGYEIQTYQHAEARRRAPKTRIVTLCK